MKEKRKVLVVEDDEIMQRALEISLERTGFGVMCASTLKEAVNMLDTKPFSVVITDIFLPDGDGLEVLAFTHKISPQTPVLAMTGYINTELGQRAKEAFGEHLFEKPFNKNTLIGKVKEMMDRDDKIVS